MPEKCEPASIITTDFAPLAMPLRQPYSVSVVNCRDFSHWSNSLTTFSPITNSFPICAFSPTLNALSVAEPPEPVR